MDSIKLGETLGIIGGVGPLASAEFLKTIYEQCSEVCEQQMPKGFMFSDPSFPSRSQTPAGNSDEEILIRLQKGLRDLSLIKVSRVVICCITMHHLLPRLPAIRRKNIVSLVDVIFQEFVRLRRPHIVLCSTRTSNVGLFQRYPCPPAVRKLLIMPDGKDQRQVQELISALKQNVAPEFGKVLLDRFTKKYGARRFICGCTEMHLLAKWCQRDSNLKCGYTFLDPLTIVAKSLVSNRAG